MIMELYRMTRILFFFFLSVLAVSCITKEPHYVINARIAGADSMKFLLQKREAGQYVKMDSVTVMNGEFTIKGGKVDYPQLVFLLPEGRKAALVFYLENSEITITGHIDSLFRAKVEGSKTQDEVVALSSQIEPINIQISGLMKEYRTAQGDEKTELEKKISGLYDQEDTLKMDFIKSHPSSYYAPVLLSGMSYSMEPGAIEAVVNSMDTAVSNTKTIKDIMAHVKIMKTVAIGQKVPDFTLNDVNDQPLSLYSRVGKSKLLLIDFWASWCLPCRQENPNVVKVWKEYHNKGFDVFGVSLDKPDARESWLQAIKNDNLTWSQVSDLQYWNCAAAKLYAVNAIPANFLIDESGTIIARNLRGENLEKKINEILNDR